MKKLRKLFPQNFRLLVLQKYIQLKYSHKLKKVKNKYKGKRCFIIGNGPSLVKEDLDRLKDEYCFAANMIYHSFDDTVWRPTFYNVADIQLLEAHIDEIKNLHPIYTNGFFIVNRMSIIPKEMLSNPKNFFYYDKYIEYTDDPEFSEDAASFIANGYTVTYSSIQLAVYMGFSEIYLLGVDHNYAKTTSEASYSNLIKENVFYNPPHTDKSTYAYRKAQKVCTQKGVKIYNATRGGHLEEFERVDFDSLF
ncbi:MAG: 6-hydroxymethylpterin diphosphokinase MptE-like protein [Eubacterium sp.]